MIELPRSSYCYNPKPSVQTKIKDDHLLRDLIEMIHRDFPGYGYRRVTVHLKREGINVNHKRIRRVMQTYGLFPIV